MAQYQLVENTNRPIAARSYIIKEVRRAMSAMESFTSLDITNALKDQGFPIRNRDVATWLRASVIPFAHENGFLYNQSLIRVDSKQSGLTLAYLYHHMNVDPATYLDRDQNPKPVPYDPLNDPLLSFAAQKNPSEARYGLRRTPFTVQQAPTPPRYPKLQTSDESYDPPLFVTPAPTSSPSVPAWRLQKRDSKGRFC